MKYWRTPLDSDRITVPSGTVRIIVDRCKGCGFCVEYCPKDILVMSEEFNAKGYHPPKVIGNGQCINCNLCEMICPDFAIFSVVDTDCAGQVEEEVADPSRETGERQSPSPAKRRAVEN